MEYVSLGLSLIAVAVSLATLFFVLRSSNSFVSTLVESLTDLQGAPAPIETYESHSEGPQVSLAAELKALNMSEYEEWDTEQREIDAGRQVAYE